MNFFPDFAPNSRKEKKRVTSVAFQSILRKQIRKLPKILKSAKIIHYHSLLFIIRVLRADPAAGCGGRAVAHAVLRLLLPGRAEVRVVRLEAVLEGEGEGVLVLGFLAKFWRGGGASPGWDPQLRRHVGRLVLGRIDVDFHK